MIASLACGGETPAAAAGARGRTWRDGAGWPGCGDGEARAERRRQRARPGVAGWGEQERVAGLRRRESERDKARNG